MNDKKVLTGQVFSNETRILSGQIIADSVIVDAKTKWGSITGNIRDQLDLLNLFDDKQNTEVAEIAAFFLVHPEYEYHFLTFMDGKPVDDVKGYLQLVIDGRVGNDSFWIPFDIGKLCLIISASGTQLDKAIRFFVPSTGMTGIVNLADESGITQFIYRPIDECTRVEWSDIEGSVLDNPELAAALAEKVDKKEYITSGEINSLFD